MKGRLLFPIRLKILATMLLVVTAVVSVITFTMANLFHQDKKLYINDLISIVALSTAEEGRSILVGYIERLQVYARIMNDRKLDRAAKASLLNGFFEDFPELIAVSVHEGQRELASVYNMADLDSAGLTKDDLLQQRADHPIPLEKIFAGKAYVRNSTISAKLPTLTVAVAPPTSTVEETLVVSAVIRQEGLQRLSSRSSGFEVFLVDADGVLLAHPQLDRVTSRTLAHLQPAVARVHERYSDGLTLQFVDEDGENTIGGFAGVDIGGVTAGAYIPKSAAFLASRSLLSRLLVVAFGLLILATFAGLFWARRITKPVELLSGATHEVGKGDFNIHVDVQSRDEIGALANSFNEMARELKHRDEALNEAQAQLVQSEKMAAFGQLGAGIAHEVKNPLAGILGCAQLSLRKAERETPLHKNLQLIEKETKRCKTIIENLLKFARQEKAVLEPVQVNNVVEDAIAIVNHQMELNKVHVEKALLDDLELIYGNANQLQQVLMNLMLNAQQAMEGEPGTITVSTATTADDHVEIRVQDTGPGMTEEVKAKLFEPFFTTKPGGKGTGLGLSVSFGIIRDHSGKINVESEPGKGAAFIIRIPVLQHAEGIEAEPVDQRIIVGA